MSSIQINLNGLSVMIGMPANRDIPVQTAKSLFATLSKCKDLNVECSLGMIANCAVIQWARDEVVHLFLESKCNRLFWIDSDMTWEPSQFIRLLALTKLRDVVSAAYPAKVDSPTFYVNHDKGKGLTAGDYGLVQIYGVGLGFTCMTREVIERLVDQSPTVKDEVSNRRIHTVFRIDSTNGNRRGEDMAFFDDVRSLGYDVWLDPEIDLGHIGQKIYRGTIRDAMK